MTWSPPFSCMVTSLWLVFLQTHSCKTGSLRSCGVSMFAVHLLSNTSQWREGRVQVRICICGVAAVQMGSVDAKKKIRNVENAKAVFLSPDVEVSSSGGTESSFRSMAHFEKICTAASWIVYCCVLDLCQCHCHCHPLCFALYVWNDTFSFLLFLGHSGEYLFKHRFYTKKNTTDWRDW